MLGFLVVCVAVLSPVLRGSLDLGVQTSVQIFVLSGTLLWLAFRIFSGTVPIPPSRYLLWIFLLFILSGMSRMLSPIHALSDPSWFNLLLGFWILAVVPLISEEKREWLHRGMPFAGWVLFVVAVYQKFLEHQQFPYAAFLNPNVFAGFILMLLPFFMEKKRWVLSLCLLWALFWTGSKGAWLCLALVLVLYHSGRRGFLFWTGMFLGFFWMVMILGDLKSPGVLHRLLWWKAAWGMIQDRPWVGFGPGAYGYIFPAYHHPLPGGISSIYAHNYFLEMFSELGIFFGLMW
ncbi:MAG: O-antigen ligase family protein, partial [Elusimicrobia bacterium]|nr:O-antigen ligase family protein [Elusimicrobiota bacterium]